MADESPDILPAITPLVDSKGLMSGPWFRYFTGQNRATSGAFAGEVLTGLGSGLEGGGNVADGIDLSIAPNGVENGMIRQSLATSVIGRFQGSPGNVADIQATADNRVLGRFGGILEFREITLIPSTVADGAYDNVTVSGSGTIWTVTEAPNATGFFISTSASAGADIFQSVDTSALGAGSGGGLGAGVSNKPTASGQRIGVFHFFAPNSSAVVQNSASIQAIASENWGTLAGEGTYVTIEVTANAATARTLGLDIRATGVTPPSFAVASLPTVGVQTGAMVYATNARNAGEGGGAGTGSLVVWSGTLWHISGIATAVTA